MSWDRSEKALEEYMQEAHGDWYALKFGDPRIQ